MNTTNQQNDTLAKTVIFILLIPLSYLWFIITWPLGYLLARFRSPEELNNELKRNYWEWAVIILIILLWIFASLFIALFFLIYSGVKFFINGQNAVISLASFFGLVWVIEFFQKMLRVKP
ncbi:hypothetical protein [Spiroplasma eriocheiris]|uniref:Transmembrane protein n=1 Tax=Spiroplasma eriocheiris TaxID=315358 RepID=A0A0H3XKR2_9MOLU|nr:hypothetical protein [Spiroplasma eriocheiris]AHF58087.1 putative transmembrane protein [Spiroplasma eriocheiris CCTCC M 207170]AKM54526.1 hypothetical protein SERIO_v1c09680 [Spiroplasma eriocheiris]